MKKKVTGRKDKRKVDSDSGSDGDITTTTTTTTTTTDAPAETTSTEPITVETKREKLDKTTLSTAPTLGTMKLLGTPSRAVETQRFKDDPAEFLGRNNVSFVGINYGSLPGASDTSLFQMRAQHQPHPTDRKQDDLFVVTRDRQYVLDAEIPAATFRPQYDQTLPLTIAIREKVPDTGVRFLKWRENRLTAMFLDKEATWVFTGPLQGCNVYVADLGDGQTALLHANANANADEEINDKAKDAKAEAFLEPMKGHVTNRLARGDYAPTEPEQIYNGFVYGRKNSDQTWSFFSYVITLTKAGDVIGRRLEPLPPT
jgi:hypothetical protein